MVHMIANQSFILVAIQGNIVIIPANASQATIAQVYADQVEGNYILQVAHVNAII